MSAAAANGGEDATAAAAAAAPSASGRSTPSSEVSGASSEDVSPSAVSSRLSGVPPPPVNGVPVPPANYLVVAWDLDTTGRRLIDEICHIGGYYVDAEGQASEFSQYVMPYKNPNPGARRSFGIRYELCYDGLRCGS